MNGLVVSGHVTDMDPSRDPSQEADIGTHWAAHEQTGFLLHATGDCELGAVQTPLAVLCQGAFQEGPKLPFCHILRIIGLKVT